MILDMDGANFTAGDHRCDISIDCPDRLTALHWWSPARRGYAELARFLAPRWISLVEKVVAPASLFRPQEADQISRHHPAPQIRAQLPAGSQHPDHLSRTQVDDGCSAHALGYLPQAQLQQRAT